MSSSKYRPALDGIRALAVLAVLIFHINGDWLPGGFVGVDVFFVLSGYLITSIILDERIRNEFSLFNFYQRRIARIFPLSVLVLIVVMVSAFIFYPDENVASTGAVATSVVLFLANIKFLYQGDYFQLATDVQPLLHYWTLSLEEQFYLVFPVFIVFVYKGKFHTRRLLIVTSTIFTLSFISCVFFTTFNSRYAFYLSSSRAWELLAGSIIAICGSTKSTIFGRFIGILGLSLLFLSFFCIDERSDFPGVIALLPVVGTVLCILSHSSSLSEKLLSSKFFVYIGKLSYSLYLWHWPIYCFTDFIFYAESEFKISTIKVFLTLGISILSYHYFENPLRYYFYSKQNRIKVFAGFFITILFIAASGLLIKKEYSPKARVSDVRNGGVAYDSSPSRPRVVLLGDSHAGVYARKLLEIAKDHDFSLHILAVDGDNPVRSSVFRNNALEFIKKYEPDLTVLVCYWSSALNQQTESFERLLDDLSVWSQNILLITEPPGLPSYASRSSMRKSGVLPIFEDQDYRLRREMVANYLLNLEGESLKIIDIVPKLESDSNEILFIDEQGRFIWRDNHHLSSFGVDFIADDISSAIMNIINSSSQH